MRNRNAIHATDVFSRKILPLAIAVSVAAISGCMVGPHYQRPSTAAPPAFKEATLQDDTQKTWSPVKPSDQLIKGDWWTMYRDSKLDTLEAGVDTANQTLKAAEANFRAARTAIGFAKSNQAPTIGLTPQASTLRESANSPYFFRQFADNGTGEESLSLDLNYEVDLWGRIRRQVQAARAQMQASAADLENARLSLHAELAIDYFGLRAADGDIKLLKDTLHAYQDAYDLTKQRLQGGLAQQAEVDQAEAQLDQTKVQLNDAQIRRAQLEHAIAVLIGQPAASFSIAFTPITERPPVVPTIPLAMPSSLLQRRPDIASQERSMAVANEQIGIAKSAYYPNLPISATAGIEATTPADWFAWPSRLWAVGASLPETLFDAGRRHAKTAQAQANYDASVASYRQTVLTGFQQVEDNLAAIRILQDETTNQHEATEASQRALTTFTQRYEGGLELYLQVIVAQTTALQNQRNDITLMQRQLDASVLLIKALGGGWSTQQLPKS